MRWLHDIVATSRIKASWPVCADCGERTPQVGVYEGENKQHQLCANCKRKRTPIDHEPGEQQF